MAAPRFNGYDTKIFKSPDPFDDLGEYGPKTFLLGSYGSPPIIKEGQFGPECPNCSNTWNVIYTYNSQGETFIHCPKCNWIIKVVRAARPEVAQEVGMNPAAG